MNYKIIKIGDKEYPKMLTKIYDPPKELYIIGDYKILNNFSIAIVGTRDASVYGKSTTKALAFGLAKKGISIVSGMAKGIDTEAHIGALLAKGRTIAVLGSGFNHIYPKENLKLFQSIINSGGAIITEYKENVLPLGENFPKRNRIISGLSRGVVVAEAKERSGSLITADCALEQGKEVFAVPGNIRSIRSKGTNALIKQGAKLIENIYDILEEFT